MQNRIIPPIVLLIWFALAGCATNHIVNEQPSDTSKIAHSLLYADTISYLNERGGKKAIYKYAISGNVELINEITKMNTNANVVLLSACAVKGGAWYEKETGGKVIVLKNPRCGDQGNNSLVSGYVEVHFKIDESALCELVYTNRQGSFYLTRKIMFIP